MHKGEEATRLVPIVEVNDSKVTKARIMLFFNYDTRHQVSTVQRYINKHFIIICWQGFGSERLKEMISAFLF